MGWTPPPDDGINVPEWKCQQPAQQQIAHEVSPQHLYATAVDLVTLTSHEQMNRGVLSCARCKSRLPKPHARRVPQIVNVQIGAADHPPRPLLRVLFIVCQSLANRSSAKSCAI
jgi:hypothetical protein